MLSGHDIDTNRFTHLTPIPDGHTSMQNSQRFGSAHASAWHAAMADGSVRGVGYEVDAKVHRLVGNRTDGQVAALPE